METTITPTSTITISSTRVAGEWNATARLGSEVIGWCQSKNKKYAETEARKGAEQHLAQLRRQPSGMTLFMKGLQPALSNSNAA